MKHLLAASIILAILGCNTTPKQTKTAPMSAEPRVKYLNPQAFSEIPTHVQNEIKSHNCEIPQSFVESNPHNVVQGSFANTKSKDWAILCSKNGNSSIFVVWGKEKPCPSEVGSAADENYFQQTNAKDYQFSRFLSVSSKDDIMKYKKDSASSLPKKMNHQGINDAFAEKGSVMYYCEKGKWLAINGAD